jgi:hypothetical protein
LQQSLIPMGLIKHLAGIMPLEEGRRGWDYERFLVALVSEGMHVSVVENGRRENGRKSNGEKEGHCE